MSILQSSAPESGLTLLLLESALTSIAVALSFLFPRLGSTSFARIERLCKRLARRKRLAVASIGFSALLLRLALLPLFPVPLPFIHDDFSFLLAADTFAHGRLTNPTPAMWTHFESFHITMHPTYMSMYFPGYGLVLAAGQVLFGNPWFASLCVDALMCAAICWMLQAWLPPGWALLGGFLAVLRLGLFNYWINSISGGAGLLAALGGALVLGALPRLIKTVRIRYGIALASGIAILGITRPYEGLLLCLPVAFALGRWIWKGQNRPRAAVLARRAALPLALIVAVAAWIGYYDNAAFGSPTTLPYTVDRAQYAMAPYFIWQQARSEHFYRYAVMRRFYSEYEMEVYRKIHSLSGFALQTLIKFIGGALFFAGLALLPPLAMLRRVLRDRRLRFLVLCLLVLMAGLAIEIFIFPHYMAAFAAAFYALGLQAMRHLRVWTPDGAPVGKTIVRLTLAVCLAMAAIRVCAVPLHIEASPLPMSVWMDTWPGPGHFGLERAQVEARLENLPGPQLAIVDYAPDHNPLDEWVYNRANIDAAKVIWARQEDPADNQELLRYYHNRTAWLVEPDATPPVVIPYPAASTTGAH